VACYYDENTSPFYLRYWDDADLHFGLFGPGSDRRDRKAALKAMTRAVVAPAAIGPDETVVDAGCGVGGAVLDLAAGQGCRALGLTISTVQARLAVERARAHGLRHRAHFARADCSAGLPLPDGSVDVLVSIEAACHFVDKARFLGECARVLRPGGRLAASDWMAADGLSDDDYREHLAPVCEAWRLASLESPFAWRRLLGRAGFLVHELEDLGDAVAENARLLQRARLQLMLEDANRSHSTERVSLWMGQYETLTRAWLTGRFTIARFLARREG
jgi:tocopherol O-methyltransferase